MIKEYTLGIIFGKSGVVLESRSCYSSRCHRMFDGREHDTAL